MSDLIEIQQDISPVLINAGIESILPPHIKIDSFLRYASIAMASNKDLVEADRDSLIMSLQKCASDGLIPDGKDAALVTFNTKVKENRQERWVKKVQYLPMIDGVLKRARMSGEISSMAAKAVYENDLFEYWMDETGEHYKYMPTFGTRGAFKLVFAYARLKNSELLMEVMTKEDVDKIRASSKTGTYGPWKEWFDRMACKSVFHRLAKRLPNASEVMEMCEQGMNMDFDDRTEKEILPMVDDPIAKLTELLKDKEPEKYLPWLKVERLEDITEEAATAAVLKLENAKQ